MPTSNPLKWHGGKSYLAPKIAALRPKGYTRYIEPYFGGGSVLLELPFEGVSEFVNDVDYELTNFWSVIREPILFEKFKRDIEARPFSEIEFEKSHKAIRLNEWGQDVGEAVWFFIRNRQSRQGLMKSFATPTRRTRRGMNENVSAWLTAVDGLPEVHRRLKRVEIRNQDAIDFITELDDKDAFGYLDPPYYHKTRVAKSAYKHEMSDADHEKLLATLANVDMKFILSGYRSELYDAYAHDYRWRRVDIEIDNKASGALSKETKTECLWMNYE